MVLFSNTESTTSSERPARRMPVSWRLPSRVCWLFVGWYRTKRTESAESDGPSTWVPQMAGRVNLLTHDGGLGVESSSHRGGPRKSI